MIVRLAQKLTEIHTLEIIIKLDTFAPPPFPEKNPENTARIFTVKLTSYSNFFQHRTNVSSASSTTLGLLFCAAFTYPSCVILLQDVRYTQSDRSYPNQHNKTLPFRESYTREKQKKFEPIRVFSLIKFVMHLSI